MRKVIFVLLMLLFFYTNAFGLRVVSLSPVVTEEIFLLGKERYLVGCSSYALLPRGFRVKKVGTLVNANIEEIVRLKPDYVFVSGMMNPMVIRKMKSLHLNVVYFGYPRSFDDICKQFLELARYIGGEGLAKQIVKKAELEVREIYDKTKRLRKPSVFVELGAHPIYTATKNSFVNDFIKFAGGINIAADSKSGLYSVEEVVRKNPDVIIISQMGFNGFKEKKRWEKFKFLNAVKNHRVYVLNDYSLCSPTPLSFVETLKKIAHFLHPGVKF